MATWLIHGEWLWPQIVKRLLRVPKSCRSRFADTDDSTWLTGVVLAHLSGCPDGVEGLEARGTLTAGDYAQVFAPLVDRHREGGQRLRLLYQFGPAFNRFTLGALWADSRIGARYLPVLDGCAIVTDIDWIRDPGRRIGTWMPCPVRVYDNAHRDEAARWLAGLATVEEPSIAQTVKAYVGGTVGAATSLAKLLLVKRFRRS